MYSKNREKQSADAYLKFLQSKGASNKLLYLRSRYLDALSIALEDKEKNRENYAIALEKTNQNLAKEDEEIAVTTARDFFAFWMNDIKAIAKFKERFDLDMQTIHWEPNPKSYKALTSAVETNIFSNDETRCLENFTEEVISHVEDVPLKTKHLTLAKTLIVRLRDAPEKNNLIYRKAIDLTLELFKDKDMKSQYLKVARELYPFWKSTPAYS